MKQNLKLFSMIHILSRRAHVSILCLMSALVINAQWSANPEENNAIAATADRENSCAIANDGTGGAIIAWLNYNETDNDYDIYAQRIDVDGVIKWSPGGIPISDVATNPHIPYIVSDGNQGAIIAWFEPRNNGKNVIFLQKVNSSGVVQWTLNGVSVGIVDEHYQHGSPQLTTDGAGGAIVAWQDWRKVEGSDVISIYAQRISSAGAIMWGVGGAQVTNQHVSNLSIASDNNGGAVVAWDLYVNDTRRDIYIQRISSSGSQLWTTNGVPICTLANYKGYPKSFADNDGGAIVIWEDNRVNAKTNIYAQKLNSSGLIQWAADGLPSIYNTGSSFRDHSIVGDGSGGAYIAARNTSYSVSFVQRINSSGLPQWGTGGIGLSGCYEEPKLINIGTDMVVTWSRDEGSGNIYAQKFNQAGETQWVSPGVGVSTLQFSAQYSPEIIHGGNGDVIIAWDDYRNTSTKLTDIYAQRVTVQGVLGTPTGMDDIESESGSVSGFILSQNHPNPFTEGTEISFTVNKPGHVSLKVFGIDGRLISTLIDDRREPGNYSVRFNPQNLPEGFIYYQMTSGKESRTKYMVHLK